MTKHGTNGLYTGEHRIGKLYDVQAYNPIIAGFLRFYAGRIG